MTKMNTLYPRTCWCLSNREHDCGTYAHNQTETYNDSYECLDTIYICSGHYQRTDLDVTLYHDGFPKDLGFPIVSQTSWPIPQEVKTKTTIASGLLWLGWLHHLYFRLSWTNHSLTGWVEVFGDHELKSGFSGFLKDGDVVEFDQGIPFTQFPKFVIKSLHKNSKDRRWANIGSCQTRRKLHSLLAVPQDIGLGMKLHTIKSFPRDPEANEIHFVKIL